MTELLWGHAYLHTISIRLLCSHGRCPDACFHGDDIWDSSFYCLPNFKNSLSIIGGSVNLNFTPTFILPYWKLCRNVIAREWNDRSNLTRH
jgi:hypothetical protein